MKKLIFILALIPFALIANAQLFVTIDPSYFRPGILYNHSFEKIGIYSQVRYGNITINNNCGEFHTQNIKVGLGLSFPVTYEKDVKLYAGVNHNYFYDTVNSYTNNIGMLRKTCFDLGVGFQTSEKLTFLMMVDFWNWESCLGINYKF